MKAYGRMEGIIPFMRSISNSSRWAVSFKLQPIYSPGTSPDQVLTLCCQGKGLGHMRDQDTNPKLFSP